MNRIDRIERINENTKDVKLRVSASTAQAQGRARYIWMYSGVFLASCLENSDADPILSMSRDPDYQKHLLAGGLQSS